MKRPLGITILGVLFILGGVSALYKMAQQLSHGRVNINAAVLMIPVGIGLLRGRWSSRFWAKVWVGFFVALASAALLAYPFFSESFHVSFGREELHGPMRHMAAVALPLLLIIPGVFAWKYLRSHKIDAFFGDVSRHAAPKQKEEDRSSAS
ncbi:hypothetical protein [Prosthecobacter sp.]|uniref:hypothetical protein n=1 Tax=Prosthecobacter sp. TaxID=1965333 RepID=UPI0037832E92